MTNNRNKEIAKEQKRQKALKKEIKQIQKKLPTYIIGFLLFVVLSIYFLEDKFYQYFGSAYNFIIIIVFVLSLLFLFFMYKNFVKINSKKKEAKAIGLKLYNLMKLDVEDEI